MGDSRARMPAASSIHQLRNNRTMQRTRLSQASKYFGAQTATLSLLLLPLLLLLLLLPSPATASAAVTAHSSFVGLDGSSNVLVIAEQNRSISLNATGGVRVNGVDVEKELSSLSSVVAAQNSTLAALRTTIAAQNSTIDALWNLLAAQNSSNAALRGALATQNSTIARLQAEQSNTLQAIPALVAAAVAAAMANMTATSSSSSSSSTTTRTTTSTTTIITTTSTTGTSASPWLQGMTAAQADASMALGLVALETSRARVEEQALAQRLDVETSRGLAMQQALVAIQGSSVNSSVVQAEMARAEGVEMSLANALDVERSRALSNELAIVSVPCPSLSVGANVVAGCTCVAGARGNITSSFFYPYYVGECTTAFPLVAGWGHTCALMINTNGVRCWGENANGQLGNGGTTQLNSPPTTDVLVGVVQIAAGYFHTCALMSSTNGVRCWGNNGNGRLGIGNTTQLNRPPTTDVLTGVVQIAAGWEHTCALMSSTKGVRCWGRNVEGQLGNGSTTQLNSPPTTDVLAGVIQIAAGHFHTCALMSSTNGVRCWGGNDDGQLGNGGTTQLNSPPTTDVLVGVVQIAAGYFHTCVLMSSTNGVRCWGQNYYGQLGNAGTTYRNSPPTTDVLAGVVQIAAGREHTCALMINTNGVRCWGRNDRGQLGIGNTTQLSSPPTTDVLVGVRQIAAGEVYTCALMNSTNGVRCWGYNFNGQLGNGGTSDLTSPPTTDVLQL